MSAFAAKGKWRPLQMIAKNQIFVETMKDIGKERSLSNKTFKGTEEFVVYCVPVFDGVVI